MLPSPGLTPPGYFLPPCGLEERRAEEGGLTYKLPKAWMPIRQCPACWRRYGVWLTMSWVKPWEQH